MVSRTQKLGVLYPGIETSEGVFNSQPVLMSLRNCCQAVLGLWKKGSSWNHHPGEMRTLVSTHQNCDQQEGANSLLLFSLSVYLSYILLVSKEKCSLQVSDHTFYKQECRKYGLRATRKCLKMTCTLNMLKDFSKLQARIVSSVFSVI